MLKIQNVKKSFGGIHALKGVSFKIPKNKITALIGPNGAGKTTLFDVISGLIKLDSGKILLENIDLTKLPPYKIATIGVSRTFQKVRLFKNLSILDHLLMAEDENDMKLFRNIFKRKIKDTKKYSQILKDFGIDHHLKTFVGDLSYGQRKLLQIAMAITRPHKLLILDEPVAGVNKVIQAEIEKLLLKLRKKGETMLVIDHDMEFVRKLADYTIALDAGKIISEGTSRKVLRDPKVLEAYLGE